MAMPSGPPAWGSMVGAPVDGVIDLVNAAPAAAPELREAYLDAVDELPRFMPQHGYHPGGLTTLRAAIAGHYTRRGRPTTADQILVTGGAGDATEVVFEALVEAGDRVLIEHPTYPGAVESVQAAGGRPVPVPIDATDPDAFVADADRAARQSAPTVAYVMPDFSNPSGARATPDGRRRLAATLARHGVVTVVDEVAAEIVLDGPDDLEPFGVPVPESATVAIGSLSKTVWGGIRIGWVRAEAARTAQMAKIMARRQLSVSVLDQLAAVRLFAWHDRLVARRRRDLRAQRDALAAAVDERLPGWSYVLPAGGLSLWCALPAGTSSTDLVAAARSRGLLLAPGPRFGTGHLFDDHQRMPFTRPVSELTAAVNVLANLVVSADAAMSVTPALVV
ncbi:putative aminotransferase [Rhodococcus opacus B4]|uniref:Putative aminotransferase n=1 Tax=Rhodococcus opacus (strain B4) TaxID=632772 RepID=C1B1I5_RHOOB|nr:putative aminotransferase [Rhodococcus opacus B4]